MSKRKNQAVKESVGRPVREQESLALFGLLYNRNPAACKLAERWCQLAISLGSAPLTPGFTTNVESTLNAGLDEQGRHVWAASYVLIREELTRQVGLLIGLICEAMDKCDASFLRDLSEAIHCCVGNPSDPNRRFAALFVQHLKRGKPVTAEVLAQAMNDFGCELGKPHQIEHKKRSTPKGDSARRQADRILDDFGVPKAKAKRGRPPKSQ